MRLGSYSRCICGAGVHSVIGTGRTVEYDTGYTHHCPQRSQPRNDSQLADLFGQLAQQLHRESEARVAYYRQRSGRPALPSRQDEYPIQPPQAPVYTPPTLSSVQSLLDELSA